MATTTKLRGNAIIGLTIFNAQIATTAGIAYTKLAAITDGNSYYSGTNVAYFHCRVGWLHRLLHHRTHLLCRGQPQHISFGTSENVSH